jgi:hypothetical protein
MNQTMALSAIRDHKPKIAHPYYNYSKIWSFNAVFSFILGGRGLGKTFGAKKQVIKNAITKGEEFIYLRRFKTELGTRESFFDDIAHEFPEYEFRVNGIYAQYAPISAVDEKKRQWTRMGYFYALTQAQSLKGKTFPAVTIIIFDEFIIEKGYTQYLPNEYAVFQGLFSTVDRSQDKTRVLFLANSVSITNPYFLAYKIRPKDDVEFMQIKKVEDRHGVKRYFIACHFPKAADFAESVSRTMFGQFIADTEFADYAVGNKFVDNNGFLLGLKDKDAEYSYTIETRSGSFSIWINHMNGKYYLQEKRPRTELVYVNHQTLMQHGKMLLGYSDPLLRIVRSAFKNGVLFFDSDQTREAAFDIFKR